MLGNIIFASHYTISGACIGIACIWDGNSALPGGAGGAGGAGGGWCWLMFAASLIHDACVCEKWPILSSSCCIGGIWFRRLWLHLQHEPHDLHATHGGQVLPTEHLCPQDIMMPSILYSGWHVQLHSSCSFPQMGHCCSPSSMPLRRIAFSIVASPFSANWSSACSIPMHVV